MQTELETIEAVTKLAQAYLALNESDKALKLLKAIVDYSQAAGQGATPAGEHRRVAQREAAGFRFAQLLEQIKEVSRLVRLKSNHELLIVQAE